MQTTLARHLTHSVATVVLLAAPAILAQQTTTTTTTPQGVQKDINIESAEVIYVSGDSVVLRNSDGSVRLLGVAPDEKISVNGTPTAPRDLKPGTQITKAHVRSVQTSTVTNVTQIDGTVVRFITPNSVILRLGDGTVNRYTIPAHATISVGGQEVRPNQLRAGMTVSATVVQTSQQHTHSKDTTVSGSVPTPPQKGVLLLFMGPAKE
ncbi:MAG TPA: hypothetical protein VIX90_04980 [Edaphobacter sp.]